MNDNIRIAKELVKLAKSLVAGIPWDRVTKGPGDFNPPEEPESPYEYSNAFDENKSETFKEFIGDMEQAGFTFESKTCNDVKDNQKNFIGKTCEAIFKKTDGIDVTQEEFNELLNENISEAYDNFGGDRLEDFQVGEASVQKEGNVSKYVIHLESHIPEFPPEERD